MNEIIQLNRKWPKGDDDNEVHFVGVINPGIDHGLKLGPSCTTFAELEAVATRLKADIDKALAEARAELRDGATPQRPR